MRWPECATGRERAGGVDATGRGRWGGLAEERESAESSWPPAKRRIQQRWRSAGPSAAGETSSAHAATASCFRPGRPLGGAKARSARQRGRGHHPPSAHTHTHTLTAAEQLASGGGAFRVRPLLRVHPAAEARSRQKKPAQVLGLPAHGRRGLRLPASPPIPAPGSARTAVTPGSGLQEERSLAHASSAPLRPAREDPSCSRLAVRPLACSFRPL